jgi:hypothetical protein
MSRQPKPTVTVKSAKGDIDRPGFIKTLLIIFHSSGCSEPLAEAHLELLTLDFDY